MNFLLKNTLFFFFLCITTISFSQNKNTQQADDLFDNYQYVEAIDEYLELVDNRKANHYVYKKLGDSKHCKLNSQSSAG